MQVHTVKGTAKTERPFGPIAITQSQAKKKYNTAASAITNFGAPTRSVNAFSNRQVACCPIYSHVNRQECTHADQAPGDNSHVGPQATVSICLSQEASRRPQLRSIVWSHQCGHNKCPFNSKADAVAK